mgnify:CR=1 FL=1
MPVLATRVKHYFLGGSGGIQPFFSISLRAFRRSCATGKNYSAMDVRFERHRPMRFLEKVHDFFGRLGAPLHPRWHNVETAVVRHKEEIAVLVLTRGNRV